MSDFAPCRSHLYQFAMHIAASRISRPLVSPREHFSFEVTLHTLIRAQQAGTRAPATVVLRRPCPPRSSRPNGPPVHALFCRRPLRLALFFRFGLRRLQPFTLFLSAASPSVAPGQVPNLLSPDDRVPLSTSQTTSLNFHSPCTAIDDAAFRRPCSRCLRGRSCCFRLHRLPQRSPQSTRNTFASTRRIPPLRSTVRALPSTYTHLPFRLSHLDRRDEFTHCHSSFEHLVRGTRPFCGEG